MLVRDSTTTTAEVMDAEMDLDTFHDELMDQVNNEALGMRIIKTSEQQTHPDTSGQGLIMSLDFHEPAIAIGNYYRVENP